MLTNGLRRKTRPLGLKFKDCLNEAGNGLLVKEDSSRPVHWKLAGKETAHCFQRAAGAVSNDRLPEALRFNGNDSEVFFPWKEQRPASSKVFSQFTVVHHAQKLDGRASLASEEPILGAPTNHTQLSAELCAGIHGQIEALVVHKTPYRKIIVTGSDRNISRRGFHGRMNYPALAPVVLANPGGYKLRIRDEEIDSIRGCHIPLPHIVRYQRKDCADNWIHRPPVLRVHLPDVSHRRMAVADVAGSRGSDHPLGRPGFRTYHQIVGIQIEMLERDGLQEEKMTMKPSRPRHPLKK